MNVSRQVSLPYSLLVDQTVMLTTNSKVLNKWRCFFIIIMSYMLTKTAFIWSKTKYTLKQLFSMFQKCHLFQ